MKLTKVHLWTIALLCAALLFSQAPAKKGVKEFIDFLKKNKETLQYKSYEATRKGDKTEIQVFCLEVTQNRLIESIDGFDTEKYFFEMPTPGNIVFTAIFSGTLPPPASSKPAASATSAAKKDKATSPDCPGKVKVTTKKIATQGFDQYAVLTVTMQNPLREVNSPASGTLTQVNVKPGDAVLANQALAIVQGASSEEVAKLEAEAAQAKKVYTARKGWKVQSEKALKQAEEAFNKATALLEKKKALLAVTVVAPCSGIVKETLATANTQVTEGAPLISLANTEILEGSADMAEDDLPLFAENETLPVVFPGSGQTGTARITAIQGKTIQISVENPDNRFAVGTDASFRKLKKHHDVAIVLPAEWIQKDEIGAFVYVAEKGKAKQVYVTLGQTENNKTQIVQGLAPNLEIITSGFACLKNNKRIKIILPAVVAKEKPAKEKKKPALVEKKKEPTAKAEKKVKKEKPAKEKKPTPVVPAPKEEKATSPECKGKIKVTTQRIALETFEQYAAFTVRMQNPLLEVISPAAGIVTQLSVKLGDRVQPHQFLAIVQAATPEQVAKLETEVAKAKKILAAHQRALVQNEKALAQADENLKKTMEKLEQKKALLAVVITAPCSGIVKDVSAAINLQVIEGAPLITLVNTDTLVGTVEVAEEEATLFSENESLPMTFPATTQTGNAQIIAIRDKALTLAIDNMDGKYPAGSDASFRKLKNRIPQAIVISSAWIQKDEISTFVYVVDNGQARQIYVTAGPTESGRTVILQGLSPDLEIITSGFECLRNDKKIKVVLPSAFKKGKPLKIEKPTKLPTAERPEQGFGGKLNLMVGFVFGRMGINDEYFTAFYPHSWRNLPGFEATYYLKGLKTRIDLWASYKVYNDKRTTTFKENPVKFRINPFLVGVRYRPAIKNLKRFQPFIGAGLNFYSFSETIEGETKLESTKSNAFGYHLQLGTYYHIWNRLFAQIAFRYNIVSKTLAETTPDGTNKLDLSGLEYNVGLFFRF